MTEVEELRAEVASLREEVAAIRGDRSVHHYHHQAAPALFVSPLPLAPSVPHWPTYYPATAGGVGGAVATTFTAIAGGTDQRCENGPRSL